MMKNFNTSEHICLSATPVLLIKGFYKLPKSPMWFEKLDHL